MKYKIFIVISCALIFILAIVFFVFSGIYKVQVCMNGKKTLFIQYVKNPNMPLKSIKPSANSILDYGDLIMYKSPELYDPPFSKKENLIARVIGKPGDIIKIDEAKIYINDILFEENYTRYFKFRINTEEYTNFKSLLKGFNVQVLDSINNNRACNILASQEIADEISNLNGVLNVRKILEPSNTLNYNTFPNQIYPWNYDFFGPTVVPSKGMAINLNRRNINLYKKIIDIYEEHELHFYGENIEIDRKLVNEYVVEKNYYFLISDDRYNGEDSRKWGFIPEEYIIGRVLF